MKNKTEVTKVPQLSAFLLVLGRAKKIRKKADPGVLLVTDPRQERWSKKTYKNSRRSICHVLPPDRPDDGSPPTKVIGRWRFMASLKHNCFNLLMAFYQDLSEAAIRSKLHQFNEVGD